MAQIKDRDTFMAFFRDEIADRCNAIESFVEFDDDEAVAKIKTEADITPLMVMFHPEWKTTDQRSDNVQKVARFGCFIVKRATKKQDRAEIKQLKQDCGLIADDIIGRLGYLNEEKQFFGRYWATDTDYEEIGPVFDNHYGVQLFGSLVTKTAITHDATKWT